MNKSFTLFIFQRHSPRPPTFVGKLKLKPAGDVKSANLMGSLATGVREYIQTLPQFDLFREKVDDINFVVHRVRKQQIFFETKSLSRGCVASYEASYSWRILATS